MKPVKPLNAFHFDEFLIDNLMIRVTKKSRKKSWNHNSTFNEFFSRYFVDLFAQLFNDDAVIILFRIIVIFDFFFSFFGKYWFSSSYWEIERCFQKREEIWCDNSSGERVLFFSLSFPCYCFVIVTGDDIYYLGKLVVGNHEWVNCRDRENFLRLVKKICFIDREGILSEKLGNSRGQKHNWNTVHKTI